MNPKKQTLSKYPARLSDRQAASLVGEVQRLRDTNRRLRFALHTLIGTCRSAMEDANDSGSATIGGWHIGRELDGYTKLVKETRSLEVVS